MANNKGKINILMLGGKRCGKTTVLASMYKEINVALAGTALQMEVTPETRASLDEAGSAIKNKLNDFKTPLTRIVVDEKPTGALSSNNFTLVVGGDSKRTARIPFNIYDIPGEWLEGGHDAQVKQLIKDCQVIIIAIDTPYLFSKMTSRGYGIFHEEYNKPEEITNFFKETVSTEDLKDRMVLFVPIKCERYFHLTKTPQLNINHRNYMQELVAAVSAGYRDLLSYLRNTAELINSCTIAITPILSAGGIDFVHFMEDSNTGKIVSLYQKPEFLREEEQGYTPRFCEQPMIYALIHVLMQEMAGLSEPKKGLFGGGSLFGPSLTKEQLQGLIDTLRKKLKRNTGNFAEDGFFFLQNPKDL